VSDDTLTDTVTITAPITQKQKRLYRKLEKATEESAVEIYPQATVEALEAARPKMTAVKLERHYRPKSDVFEVIGYWQPEIRRKDTTGVERVIQREEFVSKVDYVEDSPTFGKIKMAPPPQAGVGSASLKIWAGSVVRLPNEEARTVTRAGIGTVEIE
jgi:hypothetical protein